MKALSLFVFGLLPLAAFAQQYNMDWFKVAGGGGTSTSAQYSVTGTIGQHDAGGQTSNGQYSLVGGFWVLPQAVQDTTAPTLTIIPAAPGFATISWTPNSPGFVLQESQDSADGWTNSPSDATNPITVPTLLEAKCYRLNKP